MALDPGTQLGAFEITGLLGRGGMGEVYAARDRKLGRDVAIKILPEYFAADAERLARFEREAQTLAALNHPNIATVYGFEHDEGRGLHYLVMEHIDGDTLGERIEAGPLSVSALLPIFIDIARGLDAAHEAGIVHRDLKPDNVKINASGVVKILDFGLAKGDLKTGPTTPDAPTTPIRPLAVTAEGTFLGTPSYMSPEQARGKEVDRRTDIWAFGCCLYQALTGDIPFKGDTIADTVGAIIKSDPDWHKLPENTPREIRSLLRRCLEKEPRHRRSSAGDIAITLEEAQETLKRGRDSLPGTVAPKRTPRMNVLVVVLCLAVGAAAMYAFQRVKGITKSTSPGAAGVLEPPAETVSPGSPPLRRYSITLDPKVPVADDPWYDYGMLASPPDGSAVIYPARTSEGRVLMQRPLDDLDAQPIPGTEGALYIMFPPSGQRAAFHKDGAYWVIPRQGGKPRKVLDALLPLAAVWEDEAHVITGSPNPGQGLVRLNVDTGEHETITDLGDRAFHVASFTTREKHVLFYFTEGWPDIYALNLETGESKALDIAGLLPQYVPAGYLVYSLPGALMAVPFDIDRLETTGAPFDVTPPYMGSTNRFMPGYAIMPGGELVYVRAGASPQAENSFVWVDMQGNETPLNLPPVGGNSFALIQSANGLRLLYASGGLLWVHDIDSGLPPQQVTFEPEPVTSPLWIDAGQTFVYSARQLPAFDWSLYRSNTSGLQQAELLFATSGDQWFLGAFCVTPDRSALLGTIYSTSASDVSAQVVEFPLDGSGEPRPLLQDPKICGRAALSLDGRWLAYVAGDDLSQLDILVTSYPDLKGRWRISSTDLPYFHDLPRWAPDGSAIYYRSRSQVVRVPVLTDDGFRVGHPEELFEDRYYRNVSAPPSWYALDPDGTRFLFLKTETKMLENATELLVIEHWVDHLRDFNPEKL